MKYSRHLWSSHNQDNGEELGQYQPDAGSIGLVLA